MDVSLIATCGVPPAYANDFYPGVDHLPGDMDTMSANK